MVDVAALTLVASGALCTGYAVAALFFVRFWLRTRVALFGWFAVAFVLLAAQRLMLALTLQAPDAIPWSYTVRLLAFVLILVGIVAQNRSARGASSDGT
jgi:hypothetical protein